MTDKQIIKHNVNVSECEFLGFPRCSKAYCGCDSSELSELCDDNPNCYYKNWQRKEQECERLRFPMKDSNYAILTKEEFAQLDQLKAENEILKEKFEIAIKNNMDKTLLRLENGDVKEELQEIREQFGIETLYCHVDNTRVHRCLDVLKLKDTLTEIKEIIHFNKTNRLSGGADISIEQILQKISEVEDG